MEWIATAALVVGIFILAAVLVIARAFSVYINSPRITHLSQTDRDLLSNFRRRKPPVKTSAYMDQSLNSN